MYVVMFIDREDSEAYVLPGAWAMVEHAKGQPRLLLGLPSLASGACPRRMLALRTICRRGCEILRRSTSGACSAWPECSRIPCGLVKIGEGTLLPRRFGL